MRNSATLTCADDASLVRSATRAPQQGRVFTVSMKGIPVVTKQIWAQLEANMLRPSNKRRAYPILRDDI